MADERISRPDISRRHFLRLGGFTAVGALVVACSGRGNGATNGAANGAANGATNGAANGAANGATNGAANGANGVLTASQSDASLTTYNPNYANQWVFRIAQDKGWFEESGLTDPEVIISEEYIAGVIGGGTSMAHGDTNEILGSAEASGTGLKLLAIYREQEYETLGVGPSIRTAADLEGATLSGGQTGSRGEFILKRIVEEELGVDPDTVDWVPVGGGSDGRLQAIFAGTIDGTLLQARHELPLEAEGGHFIYNNRVRTPQEGYAALQSFLDEHEDTVAAWLAADLRARQFIADEQNKDEVYATMRELGFEISQEFEDMYELEHTQLSPDGGFNIEEMDALVAEFQGLDMLPADIDWREHVNLEPLWRAQDAVGIDRRPAEL